MFFALVTWQVGADGPLRRADEHLGRAVFGDPDSDVTVYPGGNEWAVPRRYLVPIDQAMTPIRDFLSDGHCDTTTGWAILGRD